MIRLLAVDMDGTCLNSKKQITDAVLNALRQAAENGIIVVPTTGRALCCLPHRLKGENFYRYVISSNGGEVTDLIAGESLHHTLIPLETGLRLLKDVRRAGVGITGHICREYLIQGRLLMALGRLVYGEDADSSTLVRSLEARALQAGAGFEELQFYFLTPGCRKRLEKILSRYPELTWAFDTAYVEVFSAAASKGTALRGLADRLGIRREEIACVGDAENDLPMFAASGLRFCVGSGEACVKEQADVVLPSNNKDGAAEAVRICLQRNREEQL